VGIEHVPIIVGLRRGAVNTGEWEDSHGTKLFLAMERNSNALGMSTMERDKFVQKQELPIFDGSQEYCLWLGCMGGYDPKGREIIRSFVEVMQYLGTSYGVMRKEKCTGDPARRLGNDLVFQQLAESNLEAMEQQKVKKIISICPTASGRSRKTGKSLARRQPSNITANFSPGIRLSYRTTKRTRKSSTTTRATSAAIAMCTTNHAPS